MHTWLSTWTTMQGWTKPDNAAEQPHLILIFSGQDTATTGQALATLRADYPGAVIAGCSTAGEICGTQVHDNSICASLITFGSTKVVQAEVQISDYSCSHSTGRALAEQLPQAGLRHVLVFSDGLSVNGSELARGMATALPDGVTTTGGLAGDGPRFERTFVIGQNSVCPGIVNAVGLYGSDLRVGYGSMGGWDIFGPDRVITRSENNVLYELDGQSALDLYKSYLGDYAAELPGSGLLFPLSVQAPGQDQRLVRTILGVDEAQHSLTFAGDMPEGSRAQLMRANFDRLVDGAMGAAKACGRGINAVPAWDFALLISCVGRKMVLQQRVEEEVEGVSDVLAGSPAQIGFYSYGELSPGIGNDTCMLHNQTMTITCLAESV